MAEWKSKLGSWKNKCVSVLKEDSGMGVVEVGTGNSSANVFLQARFRESHIYKEN